MKKRIAKGMALIVALALTGCGAGQADTEGKQPKQAKGKKESEAKGRYVVSKVWSETSEGEKYLSSECSYDDQGNQITQKSYDSTGELLAITTNTYDSDNHKIAEERTSYSKNEDGETKENVKNWTYQFDENGFGTGGEFYQLQWTNGKPWELNGGIEYYIDENGVKYGDVSYTTDPSGERNISGITVKNSLDMSSISFSKGNPGAAWEYTYDENGNALTGKSTMGPEQEYTFEYTYDENGNISTRVMSTRYGEDVYVGAKEYFEYTLLENVPSEEKESSDIAYEPLNLVVDYYCSGGNGQKEHLERRIVYMPDGNVASIIEYEDDIAVEKEECLYDADGNLEMEIVYDEEGNVRYRNKYSYEFQENGTDVRMEAYLDGDLLTDTTTAHYDKDGNVVSVHSEDPKGRISDTEFIYDNGNLKEMNKHSEGAETNYDKKITYEYDQEGNLVKEAHYQDGAMNEKYEYEYDQEGNKVKRAHMTWDGIVNYTEYTYEEGLLMQEVKTDAEGKCLEQNRYNYQQVKVPQNTRNVKPWNTSPIESRGE